MYHELTDRFVVPASLAETWDFFTRPANLPRVTPPWLAMTVLTPAPHRVGPGAIFDYRMRWNGVPVHWRSRIVEWRPLRRFSYLQIRGPYDHWQHTYSFHPLPQGVLVIDTSVYRLPLGFVGDVVHRLLVRRQLLAIFRHRQGVIERELGLVGRRSVRIRSLG